MAVVVGNRGDGSEECGEGFAGFCFFDLLTTITELSLFELSLYKLRE